MLKSLIPIVVCVSCTSSVNADEHHGHHAGHVSTAMQASAPTSSSLFNSSSNWKTTDGNVIQFKALEGKLSLVSMIYSSCTTACPMVVAEMKSIRNALPADKQDQVQIVLFSFDHEKDSPEALKAYAKKMSLDSGWKLLSPKTPQDTAEIAALLGIRYKKLPDGHYVHSNVFYLLNEKGEIVAKKEGLNADKTELKNALQRAVLRN